MTGIEEDSLDVRRYVGTLLSYWWLVLLLPIVGGGIGYAYSKNQQPIYQTSATLLVQQRSSSFSAGTSDVRVSEQLATVYGRLVTATPFLEEVSKESDLAVTLGQLKGMISANVTLSPPILEITMASSDPLLATKAADVVAREFIDYVTEQRLGEIARIQQMAAAQGLGNVQDIAAAQLALIDFLLLLEPVTQPSRPIIPRTGQNVFLGVLLGVTLGIGGAFLLGSLGDTVRNQEELQRRFGVTGLGSVFRWSTGDINEADPVVWTAPSSGFAESFRQIRANFQFAVADNPGKIYLVTSPGPDEGKTTVTSNLAVAMAQSGKKVLIIDSDLRRPTVYKRFTGLRKEPGLSTLLAGTDAELDTVVQDTVIAGVSVLTAGPIPPNPAELLGSPRMSAILEQAGQSYDLVILDSPPTLMVADTPILAAQVDGVVLVVDSFGTRSSAFKVALQGLSATKANIVGAVLNKLKRSRFGYGYGYPYYYNYYYSGYYTTQEVDEASVDETPAVYKHPVAWAKSVFTRSRLSRK